MYLWVGEEGEWVNGGKFVNGNCINVGNVTWVGKTVKFQWELLFVCWENERKIITTKLSFQSERGKGRRGAGVGWEREWVGGGWRGWKKTVENTGLDMEGLRWKCYKLHLNWSFKGNLCLKMVPGTIRWKERERWWI